MAASSNWRRRASRGRRVPRGRAVDVEVTVFSGCRRWLLTIVLVVLSRVPRLLGRIRLVDLEGHLFKLLVVGCVVLGRERAGLLGRVFAGCFHIELTHCDTSRVTLKPCPVPIMAVPRGSGRRAGHRRFVFESAVEPGKPDNTACISRGMFGVDTKACGASGLGRSHSAWS